MVKHNTLLSVTSLLSILLLSIHVTDDIVRGYEKWGFEKLSFVLILVVWLYATLLLAERRSGRVIMILGGLLAALIPAVHMRGTGAFVRTDGAFFFIWILLALGVNGTLSVILAARGLRRGKIMTAVAHESPDRRR
jgi:hypothetical protein